MTGSGSPCGACKFLRRKCARGCVFAPYFCHEQGPAHFAAIHKVFGASNVAKLLAHLPFAERSEAALTISYEAQARVQDPIYGCVSHIFALQQEVVNLQAQLASLKQQAATQQTLVNGSVSSNNPSERFNGKNPSLMSSFSSSYPLDVHSWLQSEYPSMVMPQFGANSLNVDGDSTPFGIENGYSSVKDEDGSFGSYGGNSSSMAPLGNTINDLHSVAFGYNQQYS
ncbi:hypothetical protein V2J09_004995 [Rumex salicifolius]